MLSDSEHNRINRRLRELEVFCAEAGEPFSVKGERDLRAFLASFDPAYRGEPVELSVGAGGNLIAEWLARDARIIISFAGEGILQMGVVQRRR